MSQHPRAFATTGHNPTQWSAPRSPLSRATPAHEVDTDFTTSDPKADYLAAARTAGAATYQPDLFAALRQLVRAFHSDALEAFPHLMEDGIAPATITWHVKISGPQLRQPVKAQHANLVDLVRELRKKWAVERRGTDVFRLVEECQRLLGGGCLEEDFEAALRRECAACHYTDFERVAAKFRSAAALGNQLADA